MTPLVFDTSVLSPFARAGLLPLLERITSGPQRLVTRAVLEEARQGIQGGFGELQAVLDLPWLEEIRVDSIKEMIRFADYVRRFGTNGRSVQRRGWPEGGRRRRQRPAGEEYTAAIRLRRGVSGLP